ncbi:MAG: universal stress protein [Silicimonas sp.]|nr:universal stress protein [Silicimonas sp.]
MNNTTTLLLMNGDTPDGVISDLAEASLQNQTHLSCLILGVGPELPMSTYGIPPYGTLNVPEDWGDRLEIAHQKQSKRVQQVEQILAHSNVSGDVQSAFCVNSEIRHHVGHKARISDIAHIAPNLRDAPEEWREAAHGVLFQSPIGLILNGKSGVPIKRIFVAWDSSKSASRAAHVALPYLKAADEVVIGCFDPVTTAVADGADPGTGLAAWLSHHGCKVTVSQFPSGGEEIAQCIQDRAKESGADLVVMGAYGHARMLQAVFGGTTRSMIKQTDLPVLLAH